MNRRILRIFRRTSGLELEKPTMVFFFSYHKIVRKMIQLECRKEPLTGLFQFSILDASGRKSLNHLSHGIKN